MCILSECPKKLPVSCAGVLCVANFVLCSNIIYSVSASLLRLIADLSSGNYGGAIVVIQQLVAVVLGWPSCDSVDIGSIASASDKRQPLDINTVVTGLLKNAMSGDVEQLKLFVSQTLFHKFSVGIEYF